MYCSPLKKLVTNASGYYLGLLQHWRKPRSLPLTWSKGLWVWWVWAESYTAVTMTPSPRQYAGTLCQTQGTGIHELCLHYGETSDEYRVTLDYRLFYGAEMKKKHTNIRFQDVN